MQVLCFDFDGVVCDSAPETAFSAWNAARVLWPNEGLPWSDALEQRFKRLRPVLHTGFEAIPILRLIEEGKVTDEQMFAGFEELRDDFIARCGETREALQQQFSAARDALIEKDPEGWLQWNRFYPGLPEVLRAAIEQHEVFIITTKQERFVVKLLAHQQLELPPERIYGLERKLSKPAILAHLQTQPTLQGGSFHFLEDRAETLHDVIATPGLEPVNLWLADWGYNTPAMRERAAATGRIRVVDVAGFRSGVGL